MTATEPAQRNGTAVALDFSSPDGVLVAPEHGDRFMLTAERAVEVRDRASGGGRRGRSAAEVRELFERGVLRPLRSWCVRHADGVWKCLIPVPTSHLEIYVIGKAPHYDFALSRSLSEFELAIADGGWDVHTMLVPRPGDETGYRTHFASDGALEVYADREPALGQVPQEPRVPEHD